MSACCPKYPDCEHNPVFTEEEIRTFMRVKGLKSDDTVTPDLGKKMFDFIIGMRSGKNDLNKALSEAILPKGERVIPSSKKMGDFTKQVKVDEEKLRNALASMTEEEKKEARENTIKILQKKKEDSETIAGIEKDALNKYALKTGFGHLYKK